MRSTIANKSGEWGQLIGAQIRGRLQETGGIEAAFNTLGMIMASDIKDSNGVAKALNVDQFEKINLNKPTLIALAKSIIYHENGKQPYSEATLRADVAAGRRKLRIKANCPVRENTSSGGVGDATTVELTGETGSTVLDIREGIINDLAKLSYLQDYVKTQCQ
ncbi:lysis system i-spanin subunit Rz [Xenorhabdus sp. Sc-CR9]|uniref:lysis system i-spanin subunit Rz n=1 Tax=Xenorhabdus sp. Sc-CR9 TaxID=2584468 RepID=UPI003FCD5B65